MCGRYALASSELLLQAMQNDVGQHAVRRRAPSCRCRTVACGDRSATRDSAVAGRCWSWCPMGCGCGRTPTHRCRGSNSTSGLPGRRYAPVSWTTVKRSPSNTTSARSGSRERSSGPSLLPQHATSRADFSASSSSNAGTTQSPACTTTSACATSSQTRTGRSRARRGTCVSASSSSLTGPSCNRPARSGADGGPSTVQWHDA